MKLYKIAFTITSCSVHRVDYIKHLLHADTIHFFRKMTYQLQLLWSLVFLVLSRGAQCEWDKFSLQSYSQNKTEDQLSCPDTWFVPVRDSCECGKTFYNTVSCNERTKEVRVADCYCITFDSILNKTVLGACLFNCVNVTKSYSDYIYHHVPRDIASGDANSSVCGYLHRKGTLCGQCAEGHYPAVYSYSFECIACDMTQLSYWVLYIVVAYVPLTIFMIFILVFRVSVVSPKLNGVIVFIQTLASPLNMRVLTAAAKHDHVVNIMTQIALTLLGIWNFDFFRTLLPGICLHITFLEMLALDYLIAVYPMIVMVITFTLVELHGHGFKPVLYMWRPFHYFFARFRREWKLHTSLIDAFVTYFVLSTTKLFHVSVSFLIPTLLYTADGETPRLHLYEDATTKYFGPAHLPYALLALVIIFLLIILPICLLVLYQFTCCKRCLSVTKLKGRVLDEFVYTFSQYYRDGSDGMMDCRWFAAFYIIIRLGFYLLLFFTMSALVYNLALLYSLVCALIVFIVQPYKEEYKYHNIVDPVLVLLQALSLAGITGINLANVKSRRFVKPLFIFVGIVALFPLVYLCIVTAQWMYRRGIFGIKPAAQQTLTPDLPDRILNSEDYYVNTFSGLTE